MVSTFTPNVQIEQPARGDDVGTWDTPVNSNMTLIDLICGGIASISGSGGNVILSAAQFRSRQITFNSTLTASIAITFPTSFTKSYEIQNVCTGSSTFVIILGTTATGGQQIAVPPGETIDCFNDGTNIKFKNLGRVGQYWDHGGTTTPPWVLNCTVPPYLNCDGTSFSSATYPQLTVILGGTTLPDSRGRTRAILNQGTGRMTTANGGVDGNTLKAAGGFDSITLATSQIPAHAHTVNDPGHTHGHNALKNNADSATGGGAFAIPQGGEAATINSAVTGISINNAGGGALHINMQPTYIGGVTMIRAA